MRKLVTSAALLLLFTLCAFAQDEEPGKNELTVWGGYAPVVGTADATGGRSWDGRLGIGALRYSRRWNTADWINIKYTADVKFVAMNYPDKIVSGTTVTPVRETRYALGAAPVGFQFNFRPKKKLQPFVAMSLGFLPFNKTTPNVTGKKLNFGSEGGFGLEYRLAKKKAVTFGYKWYHISNASRGIENPGYDAQIFYVGYTFWSK